MVQGLTARKDAAGNLMLGATAVPRLVNIWLLSALTAPHQTTNTNSTTSHSHTTTHL